VRIDERKEYKASRFSHANATDQLSYKRSRPDLVRLCLTFDASYTTRLQHIDASLGVSIQCDQSSQRTVTGEITRIFYSENAINEGSGLCFIDQPTIVACSILTAAK